MHTDGVGLILAAAPAVVQVREKLWLDMRGSVRYGRRRRDEWGIRPLPEVHDYEFRDSYTERRQLELQAALKIIHRFRLYKYGVMLVIRRLQNKHNSIVQVLNFFYHCYYYCHYYYHAHRYRRLQWAVRRIITAQAIKRRVCAYFARKRSPDYIRCLRTTLPYDTTTITPTTTPTSSSSSSSYDLLLYQVLYL